MYPLTLFVLDETGYLSWQPEFLRYIGCQLSAQLSFARAHAMGLGKIMPYSQAFFLEQARGPEARNLAVGPALFAGCGPGWSALVCTELISLKLF